MAKLIFALNQSLDGYVDNHEAFAPDPQLFQHFIDDMRGLAAVVYGRRMYYAAAWRSRPKWVVSRSLKSVGPNATLVADGFEAVVRRLKAELDGEMEVAGSELAGSLTELGLIDEYRLYIHPIVLGGGKPFFAGPRPPLRFVESNRIGKDVIRLTYVPA